MEFGSMLSMAGDVLGLASSAKSLLGGDSGRSARQQMADQHFFSLKNAEDMPVHMVKGMRAAGLNPMLVATKGFTPGQMPTSGVVDDRAISTAKQLANAQILAQAAQAKLFNAQADNVEADTIDKTFKPGLTQAQTEETLSRIPVNENTAKMIGFQSGQMLSQTHLNAALEKASNAQTKWTLTKNAIDGLQLKVNQLYLQPKAKAELDTMLADLRTKLGAAAEGDFNVKYWQAEINQAFEHAKRFASIAKPGGDRITNTTINNRLPQPKTGP